MDPPVVSDRHLTQACERKNERAPSATLVRSIEENSLLALNQPLARRLSANGSTAAGGGGLTSACVVIVSLIDAGEADSVAIHVRITVGPTKATVATGSRLSKTEFRSVDCGGGGRTKPVGEPFRGTRMALNSVQSCGTASGGVLNSVNARRRSALPDRRHPQQVPHQHDRALFRRFAHPSPVAQNGKQNGERRQIHPAQVTTAFAKDVVGIVLPHRQRRGPEGRLNRQGRSSGGLGIDLDTVASLRCFRRTRLARRQGVTACRGSGP